MEQQESFDMTFCLADGRVYVRRFQQPARLVLLGGGYVAQSLCRYASTLEFAVSVLDDRPSFANRAVFPEAQRILCDSFEGGIQALDPGRQDYVAILTRGHRHDAQCLRILLEREPTFYLGMIGSRRRVGLLFEALRGEGYPEEALQRIHTPIGLEIGAVTVDEIAISILAELIQCRNSNCGKMGSSLLEQRNMDPVFLRRLKGKQRQLLAVVIDRKGSTPVRTGAIMAIDELGGTYGTIGGGCGEQQVVRHALQMFREGKQESLVTVDMTGDVAAEEGMVCGGQMEVYLTFSFPPVSAPSSSHPAQNQKQL